MCLRAEKKMVSVEFLASLQRYFRDDAIVAHGQGTWSVPRYALSFTLRRCHRFSVICSNPPAEVRVWTLKSTNWAVDINAAVRVLRSKIFHNALKTELRSRFNDDFSMAFEGNDVWNVLVNIDPPRCLEVKLGPTAFDVDSFLPHFSSIHDVPVNTAIWQSDLGAALDALCF